MKTSSKALFALLPALVLGGCASDPVRYPRSSAQNPLQVCQWFPTTRYMWGEGYQAILDTKTEPDWLHPVYVGLGTAVWSAATPFFPVTDLFIAPLWVGKSCS